MDLFEQYEQEFTKKSTTIRERVIKLNEFSGERKKVATQETERQIEEANQILLHMEQCMRNATRERARRMETKIKNYTQDVSRLKRDLQSSSLLGSTSSPSLRNKTDAYDNTEFDPRNQNLSGHQVLEESNDRLLNSHRIAIETEAIGGEVLGDLYVQRQQLEKARDGLGTIDDNMTRSRKILSSMTRRIATNKLILAFIIVALFAANCLIIYFKWIRKLVQ